MRGEDGSATSALAVIAPLEKVFRMDLMSTEDGMGQERDDDPPARFPASTAPGGARARRDFKSMNAREHHECMGEMMLSQPIALAKTGVLGDVSSRYVADRVEGLEQTWDFDRVASSLGSSECECLMCPST